MHKLRYTNYFEHNGIILNLKSVFSLPMEYVLPVAVSASTFNKIKGTERITVFALKGNLYDEACPEGSSSVIFNLAFSLYVYMCVCNYVCKIICMCVGM